MSIRGAASMMAKAMIPAVHLHGTKVGLYKGIGTLATQNFQSLSHSRMNLTTRAFSTDAYDTQVKKAVDTFSKGVDEIGNAIQKVGEELKAVAQEFRKTGAKLKEETFKPVAGQELTNEQKAEVCVKSHLNEGNYEYAFFAATFDLRGCDLRDDLLVSIAEKMSSPEAIPICAPFWTLTIHTVAEGIQKGKKREDVLEMAVKKYCSTNMLFSWARIAVSMMEEGERKENLKKDVLMKALSAGDYGYVKKEIDEMLSENHKK